MKKVIRIVWISALSGLAFLTACWTHNGLTKKERKQLTEERVALERELKDRYSFIEKYQLDDIEEVRGDAYASYEYKKDVYALQNRLDSINFRLGDSIDLDRNIRRRQILQRIDSLGYLVNDNDSACVYGPPPGMYEEYDKKQAALDSISAEWRRQLKEAKQELEDFDHFQTQGREVHEKLYGGPDVYYNKPRISKEKQLLEEEQRKSDSIQRKKEAQRKQDSIRKARRDREGACVYGPPPTIDRNNDAQRRQELKRKIIELNDEINSIALQVQQRDSTIINGSPAKRPIA